jgi:undecaprenyl-diphosphatase
MFGYVLLAYLICTLIRNAAARLLVVILAIAMVSAIAIGRLYLGQHYISDASAGAAAGLLWVTTCISGIEIARQRHWQRTREVTSSVP